MDQYEPGSIRTYLMQMGEIPLLTGREELATARRIEAARRRLRLGLLHSDFILQAALVTFQGVLDGKLRMDQAFEPPAAGSPKQGHQMQVLAANAGTLRHLLRRNRKEFATLVVRGQTVHLRRQARRRLATRRRRAARLVEEMRLRWARLAASLAALEEIGRRMKAAMLRREQNRGLAGQEQMAAEACREVRQLQRLTLQTHAGLARRLLRIAALHQSTKRPAATWWPATSAWSSPSPNAIATAA